MNVFSQRVNAARNTCHQRLSEVYFTFARQELSLYAYLLLIHDRGINRMGFVERNLDGSKENSAMSSMGRFWP